MIIPDPAWDSVYWRPKKSEVTVSVVTETTEGTTVLTTGRKSGKGILGQVSDGNVQSGSL
jgi:hypothetical protein